MMLFSNQVHSAKPRSGADVAGLEKIAKRAAAPDAHERAAAIGAALFRAGGGVTLRCANPNAVRPPAPDDRQASRIAVGKFINPPVLAAIQKTGAVVPQGSDHFVEPQPQPAQADIAFLHSPEVSNDLRANLIDAVRRRVAVEATGSEQLMYQWQDSITDLKFAIEDLINRLGPAASALSRILAGGAGGAMAMTQGKALMRSALSEYSASIRKGGAVRKFHDLSKYGDGGDGDDFDWFSYGRTQIHGAFSGEDIKIAEMWRTSIVRAPKLVDSPDFHSWGSRMIKRYGLSGPRAEGVVGYVCGAFKPGARR